MMHKEGVLKAHKVLLECAAVSFVAHLLFFSAFNVAEIPKKPLPSYLQFTLFSIPSLWEKTSPFAEATTDPDRADTSLLVLAETQGRGSGPKLELFHKQLLWEEEPKNIGLLPLHQVPADWAFRKEPTDYSVLFRSLQDDPTVLASQVAERLSSAKKAASAVPGPEKIEVSESLQKRQILRKELPVTPQNETTSYVPCSIRLFIGVDPQGTVRNTLVEQTSGDRDLDAAALSALSKWKFSPEGDDDDNGPLLWGWVKLPLLKPLQKLSTLPKTDPGEKKKTD
jgi:TonB family protein